MKSKKRANRKSGMTEDEYTEKVCYNCKYCTNPTSDKTAYCLKLNKKKIYDIYISKCSFYEFIKLVQCNICGMYFRGLVGHMKSHNITLKKYKETEGYNRLTALCCNTTSKLRSDIAKKHWNILNRYHKSGTTGKHWTLRMEGKMKFEEEYFRRGGVARMMYISNLRRNKKK